MPKEAELAMRCAGNVWSVLVVAGASYVFGGVQLQAQTLPPAPKMWVDKDTGHRVVRVTEEPGSSGLYFNVNAFTPDGKLMVYSAPDGIHVLELATMKTRLLVPNPPGPAAEAGVDPRLAAMRNGAHIIVVGHRTNSVFYSKFDPESKGTTIYKADMNSGQVTKLISLPAGHSIATVNADETLGAGVYDEHPQDQAAEFGRNNARPQGTAQQPPRQAGSLVQAPDKSAMMERRLAAHIPVVLFTVNLQTGKETPLLHSTDWIGHMLFSPADPQLLMYCHEGPWHKVDRIWMIHTDGTHNVLMHKRTKTMEIAGHEFWGHDGESIWFDWQYPKGEDFFVAGYNLKNGTRTAYHLQRDEWSIHFNLTDGETLFAGDGGDSGQVAHSHNGTWLELFHPELTRNDGGLTEPTFWQPGVFHSEHLVNMAHHSYFLEPNVRFSPDKKLVFFTSNMFGPSYVFAVEVAKAENPSPSEVKSTVELGMRYGPMPGPTPDDK